MGCAYVRCGKVGASDFRDGQSKRLLIAWAIHLGYLVDDCEACFEDVNLYANGVPLDVFLTGSGLNSFGDVSDEYWVEVYGPYKDFYGRKLNLALVDNNLVLMSVGQNGIFGDSDDISISFLQVQLEGGDEFEKNQAQ